MDFYIDTANLDEIREAASLGLIDGVTTNPTLMGKEEGDFYGILKEICSIVKGPVSAEVIGTEAAKMVDEARILAGVGENVVIKIPMCPEGLKAVRLLCPEGIKTNVTLVFSPTQALLAAKAGADYVSPFVGRLDDISHRGMDVVEDILTVLDNYGFPTRVIVASIRNPLHVWEAAVMGAHIATIPYKILMQLFKHPLTDVGIKRFLEDWKKSGMSLNK